MKSKQLILLGPSGAGVEEQATQVAEQWQVPHVSMSKLIRMAVIAESAVGQDIHRYREKGKPVPDELLLKLLRKRFEQPDVMLKGWVLDGFPTTLVQAEAFDRLLAAFGLDMAEVAYIKASTGILISRLSKESGESVSVLRSQITDYKEGIIPVMEYYQQLQADRGAGSSGFTVVNGSQSKAEVANAIARIGIEESGAARFIDEAELNTLIEKEPLLVVDCVASWCGPCKQVSPLIDQLAENHSDRATVVKLDFDNNRPVAKRFKLKGMPSVMFFRDGELKETLTGAKIYQTYDEVITSLLE